MNINHTSKGHYELVELSGRLIDPNQGAELLALVDDHLANGKKKFIFDLSELEYINSTGLGLFIKVMTHMRTGDGVLILSSVSPAVKKLLIMTKLEKLFNMTDNIMSAEALLDSDLTNAKSEKVSVLLGLQWGDEGKGKIVDYLAPKFDIIARFQGGPNAGHTLVMGDKKVVLHTIPSGVFHNTVNVIGNGVVIDPITFMDEVRRIEEMDVDLVSKLQISKKAHLIMPTHKILDAASEASKGNLKIGSTLKGIGPAYMDKTGRNGLRVGDIAAPGLKEKYEMLKAKHKSLLDSYDYEYNIEELEADWWKGIEILKKFKFMDAEYYLNDALRQGKKVLAEGAQGSLLDIDFGTYPYVTSSNTITAGVCTGLGISPSKVGDVLGITKAYCTRVGSGPFPSELHDEVGEKLRKEGQEFGATTGRPRRCGWIDLPALKYAIMLNGVTELILTKIDVLNVFEEIKACTSYQINGKKTNQLPYDITAYEIETNNETFPGWNCDINDYNDRAELPEVLRNYLEFIERETGVPITIISTGPERTQLLDSKAQSELAV